MAAPTVTTAAMGVVAADAANGGGEVTAGGLTARTNMATNPMPSHSAASLPSGWFTSSGTGSTYAYDNGGTHDGIVSKKVTVTGGSGANTQAGIIVKAGAASEVAEGDQVTFSCTIGEGTLVGCTIRLRLYWYNGASPVSYLNGTAFTPGAEFTTYSLTSTCPATADRVYAYVISAANFHDGDSQVYSICECLVEKAGSAGAYFDGASSGGYWTGTANASTSVLDGITSRGVCWNTAGTPTTSDSTTDDHIHTGTNVSAFTSSLTGLTAGLVYHLRAYAVNTDGTSYGDEVDFTTGEYGGRRTPHYIGGGARIG